MSPAPEVVPADAAKAAAEQVKKQQRELADKRKELQHKQRDLGYAEVELETAAIERRLSAMTTAAALQRSGDELGEARLELEVFERQVRPRELDEQRIALERSMHRADHAKDELGELTAMYDADEFAKATKELVLKRGRRELELAERGLALQRSQFELFEQHELPKRLRELQRKVADAELGQKKAELQAEKQKQDDALAVHKANDRIAELKTEIEELRTQIAENNQ